MKKIILIFLFAFPVLFYGQYSGNGFGVSINYNYTSSSELFTFPNSPDRILRTISVPLESVYGPSVDFRYRILNEIVIGFNFEQMKKRIGVRRATLGTPIGVVSTRVQDEYTIYPVEFNIFYLVPFSTESFKFHFGGGFGLYFGNHKIYFDEYPGLELKNDSKDFAYGIQVSTGMDYMVNNYFSIRGEMRFRDPELQMENTDGSRRIEHNGQMFIIPQEILESKINIDGVTFTIGMVLHF